MAQACEYGSTADVGEAPLPLPRQTPAPGDWDTMEMLLLPPTAQRACPRAKTAGYTAVTRSRRPAGDESFQKGPSLMGKTI